MRGNILHIRPLRDEYKAAQPATTPIPVQLSETEFTTGDEVDGIYVTKRPPAQSWWVQKLSADFTAD